MSTLYVFAGPNGAGKSTLSATATDSGTLYDAVNGHIFEDWKTKQIANHAVCAFETNFRSAQVMHSVKQFKAHGYETRLLFLV